ncbi:MAG: histidine--tRNA ligase [Oscillospiraceae bacterium]|nr:histidine--tRNA ligase [Oscillospiraceae bacterium]
MNKIKPRTLSGFMELLPNQQVYFDSMARRLRESFSLYGFTPLDTPLMEAAEILLAKGGGETEKQIYLLSKGDTDLALRYELTTSLAKYTALNYGRLTFPFRRYEIGKVYRGERAQRGRFREFYQADIDIIGDGGLDILNEAEIPSVIYKCFTSLGLERFVIHINNRKALSGFFEILGIGEEATDVMRSVDKLSKIGVERLSEILSGDLNLTQAQTSEIINFVTYQGDPFEVLGKYKGKNEMFDSGADELAAVKEHLAGLGVPDTHFKIDLSIARGLDYYTGTVYETYMSDYPEVGSVCGGGRYDNLAEYFTDKNLPGVGVAIGLSRLFYILQEQNLLNESALTAPSDVLIIPMTDDLSHAVALATKMREAGLRTQIYGEGKKFKVKVSYADKLNIPYVVFLGEDELSEGKITVKDMATGGQTKASPAVLIANISEKIKSMRSAAPIADKPY